MGTRKNYHPGSPNRQPYFTPALRNSSQVRHRHRSTLLTPSLTAEVSSKETWTSEVSPKEIRNFEVSLEEMRTSENCPKGLWTVEVTPKEMRNFEVSPKEMRTSQAV